MSGTEPIGSIVRRQLGIEWSGDYPHPTMVMGIVNVTPDSFQSEGRHIDTAEAVRHALQLEADGADILDIGGESTRPGSDTVSAGEEIERVVPVIKALASMCVLPVSVDTRKAVVAEAALAAGARIVNDVSAGRYDARMLATVAQAGAFICLMHAPLYLSAMQWSSDEKDMDTDVIRSVSRFLSERAGVALDAGVDASRIWVDPGFGFGKSVANNLEILRRLDSFTGLSWPVLIGTSRKSTLGVVLGGASAEDRVEATMATVALAVRSGAAIVRVHDVKAAVRAARVADAVVYGSLPP